MSAYREGRASKTPSLSVACAFCGVFAQLTAEDDTFVCARCRRTQAARRAELHDRAPSLTAATHVARGHAELTPFAASLGVTGGCLSLLVSCDGLPCDVSLMINSGEATGLTFVASSPGLPSVVLSRASAADARSREAGITRAIDTGDAAFDTFALVETGHDDEDVRAVLSAPAVRAAIMQLLKHDGTYLRIDPTAVVANVNSMSPEIYEPSQIVRRLVAMRAIAGAPRRIQPGRSRRDLWQTGVALVGVVSIQAPFAAVAFWAHYHLLTATPVWIGLGAGVALALGLQPLLTRLLRGRPNARVSLLAARLISVTLLPSALIITLMSANASWDGPRERAYEMVVRSVTYDPGEATSTAIVIGSDDAAASLGSVELELDDPQQRVTEGQHAVVVVKPGAFGWAWRQSHAHVETDAGAVVEQ